MISVKVLIAIFISLLFHVNLFCVNNDDLMLAPEVKPTNILPKDFFNSTNNDSIIDSYEKEILSQSTAPIHPKPSPLSTTKDSQNLEKRNLGIISLFFLGLTGAIAFVINERLADRNKKNIRKLKEQLSADLHDDIGSTLVQINMLANLSEADSSVSPAILSNLQSIRKKSKFAISTMSDIVWSLDNDRNKISHLIDRLTFYFRDVLKVSGAEGEINIDIGDKPILLSADQKMNIFLIAKEAYTNILKHTRSTKINTSISKKGPLLILSIQNRIKEIIPNPNSTGKGTKNMELRAKSIRGSITHEYRNDLYSVKLFVKL